MNRRLFFRALAGAPIAAAAGPAPSKDEIELNPYSHKCAECGAELPLRRLYPEDYNSPRFVMCEFRPECPQRGKALMVPKLLLPAERAPRSLVALAIEAERRYAAEDAARRQKAEMAFFPPLEFTCRIAS